MAVQLCSAAMLPEFSRWPQCLQRNSQSALRPRITSHSSHLTALQSLAGVATPPDAGSSSGGSSVPAHVPMPQPAALPAELSPQDVPTVEKLLQPRGGFSGEQSLELGTWAAEEERQVLAHVACLLAAGAGLLIHTACFVPGASSVPSQAGCEAVGGSACRLSHCPLPGTALSSKPCCLQADPPLCQCPPGLTLAVQVSGVPSSFST